MKSAPLPTVVALSLVGGAIAGAAVAALLAPTAAQAPEAPAISPDESGAGADVAARLDALAEELRTLRERLSLLEDRPVARPRAPAESLDELARKAELDALREQIEAALAGLSSIPRAGAELEEQVADALTVIRKQEAVQAVRSRQEKRTPRLDEDVAKLGERLALAPYQTSQMRTALLARYEREDVLRREWEEGADAEHLAEQKRIVAQAFQDDLQRFLSEEQLRTFWDVVRSGGKE